MSKHHATNLLQLHLNATLKWLHEWRITLNPTKSVAVLFGDKLPSGLSPLDVGGHRICRSASVRYLGVTIYSKLKFSKHVNGSCNRERGIRAALYPMLNQFSWPMENLKRAGVDLCNKYENYLDKIEFISELESFKEHVYNIDDNLKRATFFEMLNFIYKNKLQEAYPNISVAY